MTFQDFDWADEVLHAQIGRRWLTSEFENPEAMRQHASKVLEALHAKMELYAQRSSQEPWWTDFLERARANVASRGKVSDQGVTATATKD